MSNAEEKSSKASSIKQKKAMRIVCKVKSNHHSAELFANINSLNFFEIVELQTATFMYNYHTIYKSILLLNLMNMVLKPNKKTCSINLMYVYQSNNIAYLLLEYNHGIVLIILME